MREVIFSVLFSILLLLSGCGKSDGESSNNNPQSRLAEQPPKGEYRAILRSMNNQLSGYVPLGVIEIHIENRLVKIKTQMHDDAPVVHIQAIQTGIRCPTFSDDKNGDGLIDIEEAYTASGEVFIPLDADLESAEKGSGVYPKGRGYTYFESTNLTDFETDAKERTGQNLNLGGRVVMIHGADTGSTLPETIATREGLTPHMSMPVACGKIERLKEEE